MTRPNQLAIMPMQWAILPDLEDAPPLDDTDLACLHELRDVLARHGKLSRFALHLAHRHFALAPDEILIERPDPDGRTQHVTVGRRAEEPEAIPTTWIFEEGPELRLTDAVYCVCVPASPLSGGCSKHAKSQSPTPAYQIEKAIRDRRIAEEKAEREHGGGRGRGE